MSVQKKLLSICIPNYNQGAALFLSIDNLKELKQFSEIEIIISDNGSTEEKSLEALALVRANFSNIRIFSGSAKIRTTSEWFFGFGSNLDRLVHNATGDYVWILGSGDLINVDAIHQILDLLRIGSFDNYVLRADQYASSELKGDVDSITGMFSNFEEELELTENSFPYFEHSISCNITRRQVYLTSSTENLTFQDSWPHVERYLKHISVSSSFNACALSPAVLLVDQPGDGWFTKSNSVDTFSPIGPFISTVLHP